MMVMDTLWLTGVLTNKQRAQGSYEWQLRVLRAGREIIELEQRACAAAKARGRGEELATMRSRPPRSPRPRRPPESAQSEGRRAAEPSVARQRPT
jgi:hypothetical protein